MKAKSHFLHVRLVCAGKNETCREAIPALLHGGRKWERGHRTQPITTRLPHSLASSLAYLLRSAKQLALHAVELDAVDQRDDRVIEALLLGGVWVDFAERLLVHTQFEGQLAYQGVGMVRKEPLGREALVMHMPDSLLQDTLLEGR